MRKRNSCSFRPAAIPVYRLQWYLPRYIVEARLYAAIIQCGACPIHTTVTLVSWIYKVIAVLIQKQNNCGIHEMLQDKKGSYIIANE